MAVLRLPHVWIPVRYAFLDQKATVGRTGGSDSENLECMQPKKQTGMVFDNKIQTF